MLQGIVLLNMPAIYLQPIITPDELSSASSIMHHIRGGKGDGVSGRRLCRGRAARRCGRRGRGQERPAYAPIMQRSDMHVSGRVDRMHVGARARARSQMCGFKISIQHCAHPNSCTHSLRML